MAHYVDQFFPEQSQWIRLDQWLIRNEPGIAEYPGVYEVGYCETGDDRPGCDRVVYIGEAHQGDLGKRVYSFGREIKAESGPHAGGRKFREKGRQIENARIRLYPIRSGICLPGCDGALAQLIERELIWEFCSKHGKLPELNDH